MWRVDGILKKRQTIEVAEAIREKEKSSRVDWKSLRKDEEIEVWRVVGVLKKRQTIEVGEEIREVEKIDWKIDEI